MRIEDHLERDHTVVCANIRLVRYFNHRYAQQQKLNGRRSWESPDILPWQAWLGRCWEACRIKHDGTELLLNSDQENVLWQQIIEASSYKDSLLHTPSIAVQAAAAWHKLKQYRIPVFPEDAVLSEDAKAFKIWADEFQTQCHKHNWIDSTSLVERMCAAQTVDTGAVGSSVVLVGFGQFTPHQTKLCRWLEDAGVPVCRHEVENQNRQVRAAVFPDIKEEIRAAAIWAKQHVEQNPRAVIGILSPGLRNLRNRFRYIFEDVLVPGNLHYRDDQLSPPFSISVGRPLSDYPLVHLIFTILQLQRSAISVQALGLLLRTPFIKGHIEEHSSRALLDETLRSRNQLSFSLSEILFFAKKVELRGSPMPVFIKILHGAGSALKEWKSKQAPSQWTESFSGFLEIFGWPGNRDMESAELQQIQSWHSVLNKFVSLHLVQPKISRYAALSLIRRITDNVGFQPNTPETPIQILDPKGAEAMTFDHIWMLGLTEESWPPRPRPNPFIPVTLQKAYGISGADADIALKNTEYLQKYLIRSTPDIILSYSCYEGDRPQLRSPLISNGMQKFDVNSDLTAASTSYTQIIFNDRKQESFEDVSARPIAGDHAKGGTGLFRDQSQCPFRAFARHRLHSRELTHPDLGLDALQRGGMLHALAQNFWEKVQSQSQLINMGKHDLEELIESLVKDLIEKYRVQFQQIFTERFCVIEARRLKQILVDWLALELERNPFTVVSVEEKVNFTIGNLEITGRLDRVDALQDGEFVIIDYKSGKASVNSWKGDQPDEPQMLLYAVTYPGKVAAVSFACLKRGRDFGFAGLAEAEKILPGIKCFQDNSRAEEFITDGQASATWEELFNSWDNVLKVLAAGFSRGDARVNPKLRACDYCDQQPLCRIHEVRLLSKKQNDQTSAL